MSIIPTDFTGFIAVVKRDCSTCRLIEPAFRELKSGTTIRIHSQDDPAFPESVADVIDERELELSYRLAIEIVPTLVQFRNGEETARLVGGIGVEDRGVVHFAADQTHTGAVFQIDRWKKDHRME